jgi:hypothetical protein
MTWARIPVMFLFAIILTSTQVMAENNLYKYHVPQKPGAMSVDQNWDLQCAWPSDSYRDMSRNGVWVDDVVCRNKKLVLKLVCPAFEEGRPDAGKHLDCYVRKREGSEAGYGLDCAEDNTPYAWLPCYEVTESLNQPPTIK